MVGPAFLADRAQHVRQAPRGDGLPRVQVGEPRRQRRARVQRVAVAVGLPLLPVQVPDVVPPADHLPHEPLHAGQSRPVLQAGLGGAGDVDGVEQAEVERHRQQRVRHPPVTGQHRVLVRAERVEAVLQEVPQRGPGLGRGHGEAARPVLADELHPVVARHPVEVGPDLVVDLVLHGPPRLRQRCERSRGHGLRQRRHALGRPLAVLLVEGPAPTDRLPVALDQQAEAAALTAVPLVLQQPLLPAAARPDGELVVTGGEAPLPDHLHRPRAGPDLTLGEATDQPSRPPRRRVADAHGRLGAHPGGGEALDVGGGAHVPRPLPQTGGPVPHRRQHQVGLAAVEHPAPEHRRRLHEDHVGAVVHEVVPELVGEAPPRRAVGPGGQVEPEQRLGAGVVRVPCR